MRVVAVRVIAVLLRPSQMLSRKRCQRRHVEVLARLVACLALFCVISRGSHAKVLAFLAYLPACSLACVRVVANLATKKQKPFKIIMMNLHYYRERERERICGVKKGEGFSPLLFCFLPRGRRGRGEERNTGKIHALWRRFPD